MTASARRRARRAADQSAPRSTDGDDIALVTIDARKLQHLEMTLAAIMADHDRDGPSPDLMSRVLTLQREVSDLETRLAEVHGLFAAFARALERVTKNHVRLN